ncbi:uncharacterized protein E0L32_008807 [Thyridium curvatum]|uniref:protein-ribulosamine 3-kinase n=1 Tax=Thyridium curvatum TaxID=1093900 RepID=A0A507B0B3_9PEZI|nr:uncharacterized protein E0L32_008807 [Thyridium curvatum]TPX09960.1 hypothetical protein E0L32_008807 [Thyridium curvatum]
MAPSVDPAIVEALGLDPASTKIVSHGGSGFASTFKLSSVVDGEEKNYFVKTGTGKDAEVMFRGDTSRTHNVSYVPNHELTYRTQGEHASLNAIHGVVPNFCPKSHAHGAMSSSPNKFFLATDFLELGSSAPGGSGESLATKLARLHTTPAPLPEGRDEPAFGFPVPTCCGATEQDNSWRASWPEFFADCRLRHILRQGRASQGADGAAQLAEAVERTAAVVVPRLLGRVQGVRPVVVHGDLWSGNHGRGRIAGRGGAEEVVFDPSCVYGHSEYELGIMRMFGGFGGGFWTEYLELVPKAEPRDEWEDRLELYELWVFAFIYFVVFCSSRSIEIDCDSRYHQLNHWALFGSGYKNSAMSIMKRLIDKYG